MTPIPGEPLDRDREGLTLPDGRKVKIRVPGLTPSTKPHKTEQRAGTEPPRDNPRHTPLDPNIFPPV
jgi:hypothetical protein